MEQDKKDRNQPYLIKHVVKVVYGYNPDYGDDRVCECGHTYYRHFDSYEYMEPVRCKYCFCVFFKERNQKESFRIRAAKELSYDIYRKEKLKRLFKFAVDSGIIKE